MRDEDHARRADQPSREVPEQETDEQLAIECHGAMEGLVGPQRLGDQQHEMVEVLGAKGGIRMRTLGEEVRIELPDPGQIGHLELTNDHASSTANHLPGFVLSTRMTPAPITSAVIL